jgi:hypothetical protein
LYDPERRRSLDSGQEARNAGTTAVELRLRQCPLLMERPATRARSFAVASENY